MRYFGKKDISTIGHHLGMIMQGIGISILVPLIIAIIYQESTYISFIVPGLLSIGIGTLLRKCQVKKNNMRLKHGMIISSLAWLWAGFIGGLVMCLYLNINFLDAFFENISAWTGSGFTIFSNVEALPKSILFLRSIEQWIGGLGVVTLIIGLLMHSGTPVARLYKSEAREEKISPSIASTLKKIIKLYIFLTVIGILLFILAGMPIFDAVNHSFSIISTGGMSIKNDGLGFYNNDILNIISIFLMVIGATSFLVLYRSLKTKGISLLKDIQFQTIIFFIMIFFTVVYFSAGVLTIDAIYYVISAITTTGSTLTSSLGIAAWPEIMKVIIILLMLIGGSAGSTSGAIKIIRVVVIIKGIYMNIANIVSPEGRVITMKMSGHEIKEKDIKEASSYVTLYMFLIFIGWFVLAYYGYDAFNALFEVVSAQGNVGLSTGIISADMPIFAKIMMIINMWGGRLEIIPILVVLRAMIEVFKGVIPLRKPY
jgi:trk system potassium uptake protein TrkH